MGRMGRHLSRVSSLDCSQLFRVFFILCAQEFQTLCFNGYLWAIAFGHDNGTSIFPLRLNCIETSK